MKETKMDKKIPVVVIKEIEEVDKILPALKNDGINCAEITFRTACAEQAIKYAVEKYPEMNIGAGTVINKKQCEKALKKLPSSFSPPFYAKQRTLSPKGKKWTLRLITPSSQLVPASGRSPELFAAAI